MPAITHLGPHIQLAGQLTADDSAWLHKAPIVKSLGDPRPLREADPRAITIFREPDESDGMFERMVNHLGGFLPTFVEGRNEWKEQLPELEEHTAWTREWCRRCHGAGLAVAGFSVPPGNWDLAEIQYLVAQGFGDVDSIAYHGYWGMYGPIGSEWVALRFLKWYEWTGGHMPPVVITECGRDAIKQEGAEGLKGWKTQGVSAEDYYRELVAYDGLLRTAAQKMVTWHGRQQPLVLGGTIFNVAVESSWANYAADEFAGRFAAESVILNEAPPAEQGGGTMWDRHAVYDQWQKLFGGQGYNPADAFGQIIKANPDREYGLFIGGYHVEEPFIYAYTTVGIFCFDKRTGNATFATAEEELPLA